MKATRASRIDVVELKVPPPVVAVVIGVGMWALSRATPAIAAHGTLSTWGAVMISLTGIGFSAAGDIAFHRAKTTMNPLKPGKASSLVTSGAYRFTRNPMYVGVLFQLVAWAVYLVSPWTLLGPVVFVAYITRFQIKPEERALLSLFGEPYAAYTTRVRRWL